MVNPKLLRTTFCLNEYMLLINTSRNVLVGIFSEEMGMKFGNNL